MKVKQLFWFNADNRYGHVQKAATPFGNYTIFGDGEVWTPGGGQVDNGTRPGDKSLAYSEVKLNEAKAWAQADFEKRVADCHEEEPTD